MGGTYHQSELLPLIASRPTVISKRHYYSALALWTTNIATLYNYNSRSILFKHILGVHFRKAEHSCFGEFNMGGVHYGDR